MLLLTVALAREVSIKIHDRDGTLPTDLMVEISGSGTTRQFMPKDNGEDGDAVAGDRLFTAKAELPIDSGKVTVTAGSKTWKGDFMFEENSDPVLLVGLEPNGMAAASTHEVMFFPDQNSPGNGPNPNGPGMLPPLTGVAPPVAGGAGPGVKGPGGSPGGSLLDQKPATPKGMWLGFVTLIATFAGLGGLVWRSQGSTLPRRVRAVGESERLYLGKAPEGASKIEGGPWTPTELALGCWEHGNRLQKPVILVIADMSMVAGPREEIEQIFKDRAEVLWETGA